MPVALGYVFIEALQYSAGRGKLPMIRNAFLNDDKGKCVQHDGHQREKASQRECNCWWYTFTMFHLTEYSFYESNLKFVTELSTCLQQTT